MRWTIDFYNKKVEKELEQWPNGIKTKFTWIVDLIEEFGPEEIGMPHIKPFGKGLFEIRAKGLEGLGRAFFCIEKGRVVLVVSSFIKKSQKTPADEILLTRKRIAEVQNGK